MLMSMQITNSNVAPGKFGYISSLNIFVIAALNGILPPLTAGSVTPLLANNVAGNNSKEIFIINFIIAFNSKVWVIIIQLFTKAISIVCNLAFMKNSIGSFFKMSCEY